jgi:cold shock CspA family protein
MKYEGRIYAFFPDRGFGFLYSNPGADGQAVSHFFHAANVAAGTPEIGRQVRFLQMPGKKGPIAIEVEVLGGAE